MTVNYYTDPLKNASWDQVKIYTPLNKFNASYYNIK